MAENPAKGDFPIAKLLQIVYILKKTIINNHSFQAELKRHFLDLRENGLLKISPVVHTKFCIHFIKK